MKCIRNTALFLLLLAHQFAAGQYPDFYNIVWQTPSLDASESMPCGGGDIGLNVWVENGDLLIYAQRSGSFNEDNAFMKSGRLRIKLTPNPFTGSSFRQELHLQQGYITINASSHAVKSAVRIWVDVFNPVANIEISADKKVQVDASYESWRYKDRIVSAREHFSNSWKWAPPKDRAYRKDEIAFEKDRVAFYHHNTTETIFDATVDQQGMNAVKDQLYNPIRKLAFGGYLMARNFSPAGTYHGEYVKTDFRGWKLRSRSASRQHLIQLVLHSAQTEHIEGWKQGLDSIVANLPTLKTAFNRTQQWWSQFWQRSFITINKDKSDEKAWEVGRNYQLFRYQLACNARGQWPTRFNGGLFTVDPAFVDKGNVLTPDYRNWGGGVHTAQNQRLVYFPMMKSGDWDMMPAQFEFYFRILKNAELRSKVYWGHEGACFTEQMENYGLPNYAEYGVKRPAYFDKGIEYNAWLEYEWDTVLEFCLMMLEENRYTGKDIRDRIQFIMSCLRFFDEHYQYLAKQRGNKALDGNGHLVIFPGSGAETFKMANNPVSTISGLRVVTKKLASVIDEINLANSRANLADSAFINARSYLDKFLLRLPPLSFQSFDGHTTIAPAKTWERVNNVETVQLYPVFPWAVFGVGRPGLDTAINTWKYDSFSVKFRSHIGWKQDNIWAARLGLREEAWKLALAKMENAPRRFPTFWGPGFDWVPDHNWGGSGMIGLQEMLLQDVGNRILLFAGWPRDVDVHFKLHAPYNTIVEAELRNGKLNMLKVFPEERKKDVELMLSQ